MPAQSVSAVHARHELVLVLQIGVVPEQVELSVHWTQAPLPAHTLRPGKPEHSPGFVQPPQRLLAVLQMGVVPEQVSFVRHWTHLFVEVLQTLVLPMHFAVFELVHWTHAPLVAHANRAGSPRAAQSASVSQP